MGLDIYLYKNKDLDASKAKRSEYETRTEKIWEEAGNYASMTDEQKEEVRLKCNAVAEELGLNEYGSDPDDIKVEVDSKIDAEHMFKIGYFRSSYNSGGIQRILRNYGLNNLDWVFANESHEYEFKPDWTQAFDRITDLIADFEKLGGYRVDAVSHNIFSGKPEIQSEAQALKLFFEELNRERVHENNYSNKHGEFFIHEPIKVLAMIPGIQTILREQPCVYVVTESDNAWYLTALKIVRETIEFVLSQEDKELYYLHWSG